MPKIRKLKRRKKFRTNVNRKRLRNKLNKLPNIECPQIKEAWEAKRSIVKNLEEMGLAYDPNRVLKIPNIKNEMLKFVKENGEEIESDTENVEDTVVPKKIHVQKSLEEEAKHPRVKMFRLPNNEVQFATYMMDKYGDDYKAMVRDRKNYYQMTWRQIKAKIDKFKNVPEQYAEYLVQKGEIVLEDSTPLKKIKPPPAEVPEVKKTSDSKRSRRKRKKPGLIESVWKEESIVEEDDCVIDDSKNLSDDEKNTSVSNGEKKLHLFPDDEEQNEDEEGDEDDDDESENEDENFSDSEDESEKIKKSNNKNKTVKSVKSKVSIKNNKKLKVR